MDRASRKRLIELFSQNKHVFPAGAYPTKSSTDCACIIAVRFGGKVFGYQPFYNPTARICEFHNFAITGDRFLVDPWIWDHDGERPVLDLTDATDFAEANARYGPEENWDVLPEIHLRKILREEFSASYGT
jgi:hypothetical protein